MSQYKTYPKYKDSGIEWIGQVPEHWELKPLKNSVTYNDNVLPDSTNPEELINYVDISSVSYSEGISNAEVMAFANAPSRARRKAKTGDVIVSTVRTYLKAVASVDEKFADCIFSTGFAVFRPCPDKLEPRFLKWLILNGLFIQAIEAHSEGLSYPAINPPTLAALKTAIPGFDEQKKIAVTLDRETARIDALIKKKTRFIELLKEKRQALITHAVTKGINPNVKMKDSGVEWIGKVPEHWAIPALKFLLSTPITDGPHETPVPAEPQDGIVFISAEAVSSGRINFSKAWGYISRADHKRYSLKYKPQQGDIYMVKSGATTGITAMVEDNREFNIWSPLAAIRANSETAPKFLLYALRSTEFQAGVALNWSYGTQQNIGMNVLENLPLPIPPYKEQATIAATLDRETARIDTLVEKTKQSITLLKERRAAFITAAVTGQIDLRGEH